MTCILIYSSKPNIEDFLPRLKVILKKFSINLLDSILINDSHAKEKLDHVIANTDFIICLGGDGTVLLLAQILYPLNKPIIPIHFGRLGFITSNDPSETEELLQAFLNEKAVIEPRILLSTLSQDKQVHRIALNEIVLKGYSLDNKLAEFELSIDNFSPLHYKSDGIIISTPTGSTGYSLSAGGAIVVPTLQNIVLTAIAPHSLGSRPIILSSDVHIQIKTMRPEPQSVSLDGKHSQILNQHETLQITKAKEYIYLVYLPNRDYYQTLQQKLHWLA